jgi:hypothetical protein
MKGLIDFTITTALSRPRRQSMPTKKKFAAWLRGYGMSALGLQKSSLRWQLPDGFVNVAQSSAGPLDRVTQTSRWSVVDLSKIKHLPLDHLTDSVPVVYDQIPIAMLLAIFLSRRAAQNMMASHYSQKAPFENRVSLPFPTYIDPRSGRRRIYIFPVVQNHASTLIR